MQGHAGSFSLLSKDIIFKVFQDLDLTSFQNLTMACQYLHAMREHCKRGRYTGLDGSERFAYPYYEAYCQRFFPQTHASLRQFAPRDFDWAQPTIRAFNKFNRLKAALAEVLADQFPTPLHEALFHAVFDGVDAVERCMRMPEFQANPRVWIDYFKADGAIIESGATYFNELYSECAGSDYEPACRPNDLRLFDFIAQTGNQPLMNRVYRQVEAACQQALNEGQGNTVQLLLARAAASLNQPKEVFLRLIDLGCSISSLVRPISQHTGQPTAAETTIENDLIYIGPLYYACQYNSLDSIRALLDIHHENLPRLLKARAALPQPADADEPVDEPLPSVLLRSDLGNVNIAALDIETSAEAASRLGHVDVLKLLCAQGVDVNERDHEDDAYPLFAAVKESRHAAVAFLLRQKGIDVGIEMNREGFILHAAAQYSDAAMVRLLLSKQGVDIDRNFNEPYVSRESEVTARVTALHLAVARGDLNIVIALVTHGARVDFLDEEGRTPYQLASVCLSKATDEKIKLAYLQIANLLLETAKKASHEHQRILPPALPLPFQESDAADDVVSVVPNADCFFPRRQGDSQHPLLWRPVWERREEDVPPLHELGMGEENSEEDVNPQPLKKEKRG